MKNIKKLILILFLTVTFVFAFLTNTYADEDVIQYSDVKSTDWFYNDLVKITKLNIINGYNDNTFKPTSTLKFEHFVKIIVNAINPNEDLTNNSNALWYQRYIDIALQNGYITEEMTGLINSDITRDTMSQIIYNVLSKQENFQELTEKEINFFVNTYKDIEKTDTNVMQMMKKGIILGYTDMTFKKNNCLKRQEVVAVIMRLLDIDNRQPIKIVIPKELSDFAEPNLSNLYELPCKIETVEKLNSWYDNDLFHNENDVAEMVTNFMNFTSNIDYTTIDFTEMKKTLIYNLRDCTEYRGVKYDYISDGEFPIDDGFDWFDIFLQRYYDDIKQNKIKITGKYYTEPDLCIFINGFSGNRGILRFKIESADDLNLVKEILFIRDTELEKEESEDYKNNVYMNNNDITLKFNTWYELAVDVCASCAFKSGSKFYDNYDTSEYYFEYICPIYIKELDE